MSNTTHKADIDSGERFAFGKNWTHFLQVLDGSRIELAETSLLEMLEMDNLAGKTFLDIGSGSGLFSLAARRLGATVHSFDYDPLSVACTRELRRRYFQDDPGWVVEEASVLDRDYIAKLGQFDIVYSWGVLHHTGDMWKALELAVQPVMPGGKLFIAIYNDQGGQSRRWKMVKKFYNFQTLPVRAVLLAAILLRQWTITFIQDAVKLKPFYTWRNYGKNRARGMSPWYDLVDWAGGFPFEVAKPEEVFHFCRNLNFELCRLQTCGGGLGCNQFVLKRTN